MISWCTGIANSATVDYSLLREQCHLTVSEDQYQQFQKDTSSHTITRVMYLDMVNGSGDPLYPIEENIKLAWIKLDFGQTLMVLPVDFTVMSAYLPYLFFNRTTLTVIENPANCFRSLHHEFRDTLMFTTIRQFARITTECTGEACSTICKRIIDPSTPLDDIQFSCCRLVNNTEVCRLPYETSDFIIAFRYVSIMLSIVLSAGAIKWLLQDVPEIEK